MKYINRIIRGICIVFVIYIFGNQTRQHELGSQISDYIAYIYDTYKTQRTQDNLNGIGISNTGIEHFLGYQQNQANIYSGEIDSSQLDIYISVYKYDLAYHIMKKQYESGISIDYHKFLDTILNLPYEQAHHNITRDFVKKLWNDKKINEYDYDYYMGLINIYSGDISTEYWDKLYTHSGDMSQNQKYIISQINNNIKNFQQRKLPPEYYLKGLVASTMFAGGYTQIAHKLANDIYTQNKDYITSNQILAYYHLIYHNYKQSIEYLNKLMKIDSTNQNFYKYLIGVNYYNLGKYSDSLLYLNGLDLPDYSNDIQQYILMNYIYMQDNLNLSNYISRLNQISDAEYVAIRHYANTHTERVDTNQDLMSKLINMCTQDTNISDKKVCEYANRFL